MEMRLNNGDYVRTAEGVFETVSGIEEIRERVLFKLLCRRGGFSPMPNLGSRLYLLPREKPSLRHSAAKQFVLEALEDENEIVLTDIDLTQDDDQIYVDVTFEYAGSEVSATLSV